jgi:hypothetical protein
LFVVIRFIFAIVKGIFLIKRSARNNHNNADNEYRTTTGVYSNYENGKTIELGKDQYKVE